MGNCSKKNKNKDKKEITMEDFLKFAEEHGYKITPVQTDKPDTFGNVFGWSVLNSIPNPCVNCPNYPKNGGSGICHCVLGTTNIY